MHGQTQEPVQIMSKRGQHIANWRQQWRSQRRSWRWSMRVLVLIICTGLFANFIANNKPVFCIDETGASWPILREIAVKAEWAKWPKEQLRRDWKNYDYRFAIWPLIPYHPKELDSNASTVSPFDKQDRSLHDRHWLGTDRVGADLLANLVWGCRTAITVGFGAVLIALLIGLPLGALAGYFGNRGSAIPISEMLFGTLGFFLGYFWGFVSRAHLSVHHWWTYMLVGILLLLATTAIMLRLGRWLHQKGIGQKTVHLPIDGIVMRLIETINAIPGLILLLGLVAIIRPPSIWSTILVIGLLSWTGIARFVRGEMLRIRSLEYIEAARSMGLQELRVLWRHALPNALGPVYILVAFGIAGAILTEASLSFLNIGIPDEFPSWGKILAEGRQSPRAWWLALFPGLALFISITMFNILGDKMSERT